MTPTTPPSPACSGVNGLELKGRLVKVVGPSENGGSSHYNSIGTVVLVEKPFGIHKHEYIRCVVRLPRVSGITHFLFHLSHCFINAAMFNINQIATATTPTASPSTQRRGRRGRRQQQESRNKQYPKKTINNP